MDLSQLQATAVSVMQADSYLYNGGTLSVPILSEDLGNVATELALSVYKTSGIMVYVQTPVGHNDKPNVNPPQMAPKMVCTVIEQVTLNRGAKGTGQAIGKVAEHVACLLHQNLAFGSALPLFTDILISKAYLPLIARDVVFSIPWSSLQLQNRP